MTERTVMLTVQASTDEAFVTAFEHLARNCAGLMLEGRDARVWAYETEDEEVEA